MTLATVALIAIATATGPKDVVKTGSEKLQAVLKKPAARSPEIMKAVEAFVDFGELARRSLGEAWDQRSPQERTEFVATMTDVLRANYEETARNQLGGEMVFDSEELDGDEASVNARVKAKKEVVPLVYKLYKANGAWKVYDLVVDESSLLDVYRDSFKKTIATKGFAGLLQQLKAKKSELEKRKKT